MRRPEAGTRRQGWVQCFDASPRPRMRLLCFPHAGGGTWVFRRWGRALPPAVEVWPIALPGRGPRLREASLTRIDELARAAADALEASLELPFACFGHSFGGLVAFEFVRELRRRGAPAPLHLFASATPAPRRPRRLRAIHMLPDDEFLREITALGGTPSVVSENPELMSLMLPSLRADLEAYATYRYAPEEPLSCPVTAFGGAADSLVRAESLAAWSEETSAPCRVRMLPGGHFFVTTRRELLLSLLDHELRDPLARVGAPPPPGAAHPTRDLPNPPRERANERS